MNKQFKQNEDMNKNDNSTISLLQYEMKRNSILRKP
jgi:hypothetical protein